jgi:hypothetical protein
VYELKQKSSNNAKDIYDDDNIPEIDLPKKNSTLSESSSSKDSSKKEEN